LFSSPIELKREWCTGSWESSPNQHRKLYRNNSKDNSF